MHGLRETASFLMAAGHPQARFYPLPMLWAEAQIVRKRENQRIVTDAVMTRITIASVLSKQGSSAFEKQVKALSKG